MFMPKYKMSIKQPVDLHKAKECKLLNWLIIINC